MHFNTQHKSFYPVVPPATATVSLSSLCILTPNTSLSILWYRQLLPLCRCHLYALLHPTQVFLSCGTASYCHCVTVISMHFNTQHKSFYLVVPPATATVSLSSLCILTPNTILSILWYRQLLPLCHCHLYAF